MANRKRELSTYPEFYFRIVERVARGETCIQLPMPDRKAATSTAHDFHRFRLVMHRERHPLAEYALDTTCRLTNLKPAGGGLEGRYILEFIPRGLARLADEIRGKPQPGQQGMPSEQVKLKGFDELIGSMSKESVPSEGVERILRANDQGEEDLKRMLGIQEEACQHEWDTTGVFCLKCKVPK